MITKYMCDKSTINVFGLFLFLVFFLFVLPVYAQTPPPQQQTGLVSSISLPSPLTMLANIQSQLPNLMRLVTAIAYVMGFILVIMGIINLKHAGEMRTQMSHEHNLSKPILFIVIGAMLIYLPSAVQIGLSTFWAEPNPYGYVTQSDQWQQAINICYAIVQFIGVIAFIRGLLILTRVGHGGHHDALGKGITHIIGGILCINMYQFIQVLLATLGVQM